MHPIERLRYVARARGAGQAALVAETAAALRSFGTDPQALVTACRRIVARQPGSGPLWFLAARALTSPDAVAEAQRAAAAVADDPTPRHLARALPEDATVTVIGWPEQIAAALPRRGDVEVLVADGAGEGAGLVDHLTQCEVGAEEIPDRGVAVAVGESDVVLVEALVAGPESVLVAPGSHAAAATAAHAGVPVWLVAGVGRWLPTRMFDGVVDRVVTGEPWWDPLEPAPLGLVDQVVGARGPETPADAVARIDCPVAPELLRTL